MVRCVFAFILVVGLAVPAYAGSLSAVGRSAVQGLSMQSVKHGLAGFILSACLGLSGCAWNLVAPPLHGNDSTEQVVVYADETQGDLANTRDHHRDTHTVRLNTVWGNDSAEARAESHSDYTLHGYYSGWTNVSSHGHIKFGSSIEWHGHQHHSKWLTEIKDGYIYGIRQWNSSPYFDNRQELAGDALSSVLFTYVVDGVVLVGIGQGAPYKSAHPDYERDQTLTHVKRLGTLVIGAPRPGWYERIAVADVSGVLFTHHPDYEQARQVSFAERSMHPLVEDWLALQDEVTQLAYHQSEGVVIFQGERLGIFTDGERLIGGHRDEIC